MWIRDYVLAFLVLAVLSFSSLVFWSFYSNAMFKREHNWKKTMKLAIPLSIAIPLIIVVIAMMLRR